MTYSFDKDNKLNIEVSTHITTTLKKKETKEEDYWNEIF